MIDILESLSPEDIEIGDYVDFGRYGRLYICDREGDQFWVTDDPNDAGKQHVPGWYISADLAQEVLGSIYDPDDDDDDLDESLLYMPIYEEDEDDDDFIPQATSQKYTSADTSINSSKLPAVYKMIADRLESGTVGVDFGGGRYDNAIEELAKNDITLVVYDPYNRSDSHNKAAIDTIRKNGGADFAVNSNVLNVIAEEDARQTVIRNIYKLLKSGAPAYFTVYEGDGSGEGKETSKGYQLNRKTAEYVPEIQNVFSNVSRKGKLIIATK